MIAINHVQSKPQVNKDGVYINCADPFNEVKTDPSKPRVLPPKKGPSLKDPGGPSPYPSVGRTSDAVLQFSPPVKFGAE
ncbi:Hypothetical protein NTJ_12338 [Nesidiocoris tenuis]|uniref:Uncharacterized protein n=1 Tax=Nesidiocoris tenuis TaxID=355587 RepID=A0ABN7B534_9HEMI|nr:Hypothetical protein NTJ_12338 [Nesidiocoris tenuis]